MAHKHPTDTSRCDGCLGLFTLSIAGIKLSTLIPSHLQLHINPPEDSCFHRYNCRPETSKSSPHPTPASSCYCPGPRFPTSIDGYQYPHDDKSPDCHSSHSTRRQYLISVDRQESGESASSVNSSKGCMLATIGKDNAQNNSQSFVFRPSSTQQQLSISGR